MLQGQNGAAGLPQEPPLAVQLPAGCRLLEGAIPDWECSDALMKLEDLFYGESPDPRVSSITAGQKDKKRKQPSKQVKVPTPRIVGRIKIPPTQKKNDFKKKPRQVDKSTPASSPVSSSGTSSSSSASASPQQFYSPQSQQQVHQQPAKYTPAPLPPQPL